MDYDDTDIDDMDDFYNDDTTTMCSKCGAIIDDEFIMPIEGNFYCDDCEPEEWNE